MKQILAITRKELEGYFGSLLSVIFLGVFLAVVLFTFFFVEKFFARGLADIRPMFKWMPLLLVFLLAAITMRQWSEEQRSGTLEILLTLPVKPLQLVLGKFLAVMVIIIVALALTLPLPLTVSLIGPLDWGPVVGGYLAAILMAAAYAAIGLFISSRTDNQIVSLILTVLVGGVFYLVGTRAVTDLFGRTVSDILWGIGTGSRFESIQRGVVDLRDLIYYLSLTALFLLLNVVSLDSMRWSRKQTAYRFSTMLTSGLMALNLVLVNVWMFPLQGLRLDLTAQKEFTISKTTRELLSNLEEPLLIRAYISEKTHPLLAPLAPQISDMLSEYEIASRGMITAEVIDPIKYPALEEEANQTYGIHPTPFQITGANETSVINSYFDILIRYGDQSVVLTFNDLIEVTQTSSGVNVSLRNLEYDLTKSIKKVVTGFQSVDAVLGALSDPVKLQFFVTPNTVPDELLDLIEVINQTASKIAQDSGGKLQYEMIDPSDPSSPITQQQLIDQYGLQPYSAGLFSNETYYFDMILINKDKAQFIYPDPEMTEADVRNEIEDAIKRTSTGFLKVVGLWTPPYRPTTNMFGQTQNPISSYQYAQQALSDEYTVQAVDLSSGEPPTGIDVLVVIAPQNLTKLELFAIDQYLMRGGSVVMAASNYKVDIDPYFGGLMMFPIDGGVKELLAAYGVNLSDYVIMDTQNEPFPVTVTRNAGGYQVQEIQAVPYPFFEDVRSTTMNLESPIMANLPTVTMYWSSPVELDATLNAGRTTQILLYSNETSWTVTPDNIMPNFDLYPELGFAEGSPQQSYPLGVSIQGVFTSAFAETGRPQPEPTPDPASQFSSSPEEPTATPEAGAVDLSGMVTRSPETARLVVIGSNTFVDDFTLQLSSRMSQSRYLNNLHFLQNAVNWSVEDLELLSIRSRGTYTRVLKPMTETGEVVVEAINYGVALLALVAIYVFWQIRRHNERPLELLPARKQKDE